MKRLIVLGLGAVLLTSAAPLWPAGAESAKVDIIHKGRLMSVPAAAVPAHLRHGDVFPCVPPRCD